MKTFVVISDTHGDWRHLGKISPLFEENDYVVHLGDGVRDMRPYTAQFADKFYLIQGNNDFSSALKECVIKAEGHRIFCCHGHRYGVKRGLDALVDAAKERDCDVALYGHTHTAEVLEKDGVLCINPGALSGFVGCSYCYLVVHKEKVVPTIVEVSA